MLLETAIETNRGGYQSRSAGTCIAHEERPSAGRPGKLRSSGGWDRLRGLLTVRFIAEEYGIRELKDAMSREVLKALDEAGS